MKSRSQILKVGHDEANTVRAAAAATLAKAFKGAKPERMEEILETLASLGQARAVKDGKYIGV